MRCYFVKNPLAFFQGEFVSIYKIILFILFFDLKMTNLQHELKEYVTCGLFKQGLSILYGLVHCLLPAKYLLIQGLMLK